VLESASAATDLDLITYLRSIPDARMRRGVRFPAWYLLLVAVLGILSGCQSLRDLERFAIRHHTVLTEALGLELRRPPSDSSFRYFFHQVDVAALCAAIRDWTIAQIPGGAADLDQLVCDGKALRGSIVPTAGGGSACSRRDDPPSSTTIRSSVRPEGEPMHGFKTATAQPSGAHEATGLSAAAGVGSSCHSPVLLQQQNHISVSPGVDGGGVELVSDLNKIASSLLLSSPASAHHFLCYSME
jgi:hypothetical protein